MCSNERRIYTLEEFEKEFPFKVGDKVLITCLNEPFEIIALELFMNKLCYRLNNGLHYGPKTLTIYKEMKEERNITLTLDKAREWYKKGGDLKQVALQAFSEKELTKVDLPKTWEEFCANYPIQIGEAIVDTQTSQIRIYKGIVARGLTYDKNIYPSEKSGEAHLAMIQLEQLRNCWRQGWISQKGDSGFGIRFDLFDGFKIIKLCSYSAFLSFPTREMAEEFLECFRDLIEKAGDLI
jgi:hypothetical protein